MIGENLQKLRKEKGLSQEMVAEKIGVSRQTVAKWEAGDSVPDLDLAVKIAELYEVSLDTIAGTTGKDGIPPGKYIFGAVRIGERGQISIPKKCREVFALEPGDMLAVLGDINRGIALMKLSTEMFAMEEDEK